MKMLSSLSLYELLSLIVGALNIATIFVGMKTIKVLLRQTHEVGQQTQYLAESLRNTAYQSVTDHLFRLNDVFIQHPELRPYFYAHKPLHLNDPHWARVMGVADLMLNVFDTILLQKAYLPQYWPNTGLEAYIVTCFTNSSVLCSCCHDAEDRFADDLRNLMEQGAALRGAHSS